MKFQLFGKICFFALIDNPLTYFVTIRRYFDIWYFQRQRRAKGEQYFIYHISSILSSITPPSFPSLRVGVGFGGDANVCLSYKKKEKKIFSE